MDVTMSSSTPGVLLGLWRCMLVMSPVVHYLGMQASLRCRHAAMLAFCPSETDVVGLL